MTRSLARVPQKIKKPLTRKEENLLQTRAAFYLSLGYSAKALSGKLNIKYSKALKLTRDPIVIKRKTKYSENFLSAAQEKFEFLFHDSVDRLQSIIKHASPEDALKAIKLIFDAQGRIPNGKSGGGNLEDQMAAMMQAGGGMFGQFALPSNKVNSAMELLARSREGDSSNNE